jgi:hypothetical protein
VTTSKKITAGIVAPLLVAGTIVAVVFARQQILASCLIGSWRATSAVATITSNGHRTTNTITSLRLRYDRNGAMEQRYTDAIARLDGEMAPLSGTVTYAYQLSRDRLTYTNGRGPDQAPERDFAETARCQGDELTLTGTIDYGEGSGTSWANRLARE